MDQNQKTSNKSQSLSINNVNNNDENTAKDLLEIELNDLKNKLKACDEQRLELEQKLSNQKTLYDHECRMAKVSVEKANIQFNAQLSSLMCDLETWKLIAEANTEENKLLAAHLKAVEIEKLAAERKVGELTEENSEYKAAIKKLQICIQKIECTMGVANEHLDVIKSGYDDAQAVIKSYNQSVD